MSHSPPVDEDQSVILTGLSAGAAFGFDGPVRRIDTHGAIVFLVGDRAFKMKRAVRYDYMDYGSRERRAAMCKAELEINYPQAPGLYLGLAPVVAGDKGAVRVGEVLLPDELRCVDASREWLVVMRRFDDRDLFAAMADRGALDETTMAELASIIAAFHDRATPSYVHDGPDRYRDALRADALEMERHADILDADAGASLSMAMRDALEPLLPMIERRQRGGAVRRCHGDLHLRNICLFAGHPTLFDAIEFSERMATIDVLYDLAFLLMDLEHRGLRTFANIVLNHWLWHVADVPSAPHLEALSLLPLLLARRAAIRAHVGGAAARLVTDDAERKHMVLEARHYQHRAASFLRHTPPKLAAIGGLSGSGKTTLAMAIAGDIGRAPGAVVLRTDVVRKRLAGIPLEQKMPPGSYGTEQAAQVYGAVLKQAETALRAGHSVVVDAVFARPSERAAIAAVAASVGVDFAGLWLDIGVSEARKRVAGRKGDASDADTRVVERQAGYDLGVIEWPRIDAALPLADIVTRARRLALA